MDKIVQRWKRAMSGCASRTDRSSLIDNDFLQPIVGQPAATDNQQQQDMHIQIYSDYDLSKQSPQPQTTSNKDYNNSSRRKNFLTKRLKTEKAENEKTIQKQNSGDSNYFSDNEAHYFEILSDEDDYYNDVDDDEDEKMADHEELLMNFKESKTTSGSKTNLYPDLSNIKSDLKKESKLYAFLESKYNRLRRNLLMNKENIPQQDYDMLTKQIDQEKTSAEPSTSTAAAAAAVAAAVVNSTLLTTTTLTKKTTLEINNNTNNSSNNASGRAGADVSQNTYAKLRRGGGDGGLFSHSSHTYAMLNLNSGEINNENEDDDGEGIVDKNWNAETNTNNKSLLLTSPSTKKRKHLKFDYNRLRSNKPAETTTTNNNNNNQKFSLRLNFNSCYQVENKDNKSLAMKVTCLTEIKSSNLFATQYDGVIWYINLLCDKMYAYVRDHKDLNELNFRRRQNMINAHLLYAKNFYEVRHATSKQLKAHLANYHPCSIALACLLDSDAVRITESHSCFCDNYVYLFSTKIKFCAWKTKFYVILKKPKRSSMGRLSLIEDIINCYKLFQDRTIF